LSFLSYLGSGSPKAQKTQKKIKIPDPRKLLGQPWGCQKLERTQKTQNPRPQEAPGRALGLPETQKNLKSHGPGSSQALGL